MPTNPENKPKTNIFIIILIGLIILCSFLILPDYDTQISALQKQLSNFSGNGTNFITSVEFPYFYIISKQLRLNLSSFNFTDKNVTIKIYPTTINNITRNITVINNISNDYIHNFYYTYNNNFTYYIKNDTRYIRDSSGRYLYTKGQSWRNISFNESRMNQTIAEKLSNLTKRYFPVHFNITLGTNNNGGVLANITTIDGKFVRVAEVIGGFIINARFTNVTTFTYIESTENYNEPFAINDNVYLQIQNCTGSWVSLDLIDNQDSVFVTSQHTVANVDRYICGVKKNVTVRWSQIGSGTSSHRFSLDQMNLVYNNGFGGSVLSGSGRINTIPKWIDPISLGNSAINDTGTQIKTNLDINLTKSKSTLYISSNKIISNSTGFYIYE